MTEDQILDALKVGAVVNITDSGEASIMAMDDLPPILRECYRASRAHVYEHQSRCPSCLENLADNILMDADSHREDGNVDRCGRAGRRSGRAPSTGSADPPFRTPSLHF
jgi:hypothetical protein